MKRAPLVPAKRPNGEQERTALFNSVTVALSATTSPYRTIEAPGNRSIAEELWLKLLANQLAPRGAMDSAQPRASGDLEARFSELAAAWRCDKFSSSSTTQIVTHPAYQRIIGLGPAVVPLILRELGREPDHWFWALKAITGADPVPSEERGNVRAMAARWLTWGREQGYGG